MHTRTHCCINIYTNMTEKVLFWLQSTGVMSKEKCSFTILLVVLRLLWMIYSLLFVSLPVIRLISKQRTSNIYIFYVRHSLYWICGTIKQRSFKNCSLFSGGLNHMLEWVEEWKTCKIHTDNSQLKWELKRALPQL